MDFCFLLFILQKISNYVCTYVGIHETIRKKINKLKWRRNSGCSYDFYDLILRFKKAKTKIRKDVPTYKCIRKRSEP